MPNARLQPIHALVGSDSFLQLQHLATILDQSGPGTQRIDIDGERAELAEVLDEVRCFAMFGGPVTVPVAVTVLLPVSISILGSTRLPLSAFIVHCTDPLASDPFADDGALDYSYPPML